MDQAIRISTLNDFVFCPRSIYFHWLYGNLDATVYHEVAQEQWLHSHKTIDDTTYSTRRTVLQWLTVYSQKYNLIGKIDVFDMTKRTLRERKHKIKKIYDWYVFQLVAQYICLEEMWYKVEHLKLHSYSTNQSFEIDIQKNIPLFNRTINSYKDFLLKTQPLKNFSQNPHKCASCIYKHVCDFYLLTNQ